MERTAARTRHNGHALSNDVMKNISKIKDALSEVGGDIRSTAGNAVQQSWEGIKDQSLLAKENVETYTAEHPLKTLTITLLAGMALGFLLRGRRGKR